VCSIGLVWRLAFGIAGAIGAAEVVLSLICASGEPPRERHGQQLLALTLPFYILIVAIAIHPSLASNVGIHLKPLETEAIFVLPRHQLRLALQGAASLAGRVRGIEAVRIRHYPKEETGAALWTPLSLHLSQSTPMLLGTAKESFPAGVKASRFWPFPTWFHAGLPVGGTTFGPPDFHRDVAAVFGGKRFCIGQGERTGA
jgi:hypothetical protein